MLHHPLDNCSKLLYTAILGLIPPDEWLIPLQKIHPALLVGAILAIAVLLFLLSGRISRTIMEKKKF